MRARGTGCIYKPKGTPFFYVKYFKNGQPIRESTGTTDERKAEKFLTRRLGEIASDRFLGPQMEKITVDELAEDLIRDYRVNGKRSLDSLTILWDKHLKPFFGLRKALSISSSLISTYIDRRQRENATNASINRELSALKRAFSLAIQAGKLLRAPHIPRLKENNIRTGFLESEQYQRLAVECGRVGLWLRALVETAYTFGFRRGELLGMRCKQVDIGAKTITLYAGETKSGEGRTISFEGQPGLETLLTACCVGKSPDAPVFAYDNGHPIGEFRKTWLKVCAKAGVPDLLFHDLRRSAIRRMVRAGISEKVAMTISGHLTRSVFDRYDIVSEADLRNASRKLGAVGIEVKATVQTLVQSPTSTTIATTN